MAFRKTCEINDKKKLIIRLPDSFKSRKHVKVTIEGIDDEKAAKLALMKQASKDPLFLSNIREIKNDFKYADWIDS